MSDFIGIMLMKFKTINAREKLSNTAPSRFLQSFSRQRSEKCGEQFNPISLNYDYVTKQQFYRFKEDSKFYNDENCDLG